MRERANGHRWAVPVALLGIVGLGAYFRLADLGLAAFRADEGFFWEICNRPMTAGQVFSTWMDVPSFTGQFPFAAAFTKWFIGFFGLTVSDFTVRLPSALWGIATVAAAFGAGRSLAGPVFGLGLALLVALNPYQLQMTRESYYYAPMICGAFLGLWTVFAAGDALPCVAIEFLCAVAGFGGGPGCLHKRSRCELYAPPPRYASLMEHEDLIRAFSHQQISAPGFWPNGTPGTRG